MTVIIGSFRTAMLCGDIDQRVLTLQKPGNDLLRNYILLNDYLLV
jgi:hypothetical protein